MRGGHKPTPDDADTDLAPTPQSRKVIHKKLGNSKFQFPQQPALRPFGELKPFPLSIHFFFPLQIAFFFIIKETHDHWGTYGNYREV